MASVNRSKTQLKKLCDSAPLREPVFAPCNWRAAHGGAWFARAPALGEGRKVIMRVRCLALTRPSLTFGHRFWRRIRNFRLFHLPDRGVISTFRAFSEAPRTKRTRQGRTCVRRGSTWSRGRFGRARLCATFGRARWCAGNCILQCSVMRATANDLGLRCGQPCVVLVCGGTPAREADRRQMLAGSRG